MNLSLGDMLGEQWRDISDFEGYYQISNMGRVKSLGRIVSRRPSVLKLKTRIRKYYKRPSKKNCPGCQMYASYILNKDGEKYVFSGHRLVAKAFLPNPLNLPEVNHIDNNGLNNCVTNLEWVTSQENSLHAIRIGVKKVSFVGESSGSSFLRNEQVLEMIHLRRSGWMLKDLSRRYSMSMSAISAICNGKTWKHLSCCSGAQLDLTVREVSLASSVAAVVVNDKSASDSV